MKQRVDYKSVAVSKDRDEHDFYPTPESCVRDILSLEVLGKTVLEPACGDGAISKVLIEKGYSVTSSDLIDRGYGIAGVDFLTTYSYGKEQFDSVITNPPFKLMLPFLSQSLRVSKDKVVFFGKLNWLEGQKRSKVFENTPLKTVYVYRARQKVYRRRQATESDKAGFIAFCWYVWQKGYTGAPEIRWI